MAHLKSLKTKGKKSKNWKGCPSQPCRSERLFAEQRACPGGGGNRFAMLSDSNRELPRGELTVGGN